MESKRYNITIVDKNGIGTTYQNLKAKNQIKAMFHELLDDDSPFQFENISAVHVSEIVETMDFPRENTRKKDYKGKRTLIDGGTE